jgi:hypothetical protein
MAKHRRNSDDDGISFNDAMGAIRKWYYSEVKEWADEFDKRIEKGEFDDREDFMERFDEETDSAGIIIYTQQAKGVLFASDNEDAYEEEFGEAAPTVEAAALMAFRRDIMEAMDSDTNDDETFEAEEEEEDDDD